MTESSENGPNPPPADPEADYVLAEKLLAFARRFPWRIPHWTGDPDENHWMWWNPAFLVAGGRLLKGVVQLSKANLARESELLVRALLELVGNQYYMGADKSRAHAFAAQGLASREELFAKIESYGIGSQQERRELRELIDRERAELESSLPLDAQLDEPRRISPFGKTARQRIESAGMDWHYDLVYSLASDLTHMNARALSGYLQTTHGALVIDLDFESGPRASVGIAIEIFLRLLYKVDEALRQDQEDEIDKLGTEYGRLVGRRDSPPESILPYLRPAPPGNA